MIVIIVVLLLAGAALGVASRQPHIVFILVDDYGFNDISYHAHKNGNDTNIIDTPNLDALAAAGIKLENYYVQPVCSPTRAALLSGRYGLHTGIHTALVDSARGGLPLDEVLLPQLLRKVGYATYALGKWHLGFESWAHTPLERGFDSYLGFYAGSSDYYSMQSECWPGSYKDGCFESTNKGEPVTGCDLHCGRQPICNLTSNEYSTLRFTREAIELIDRHPKDGTPMFLYLAHQAVHVGNRPLPSHPEYELDQAPSKYIDKYRFVANEQRRNLSAMVAALDEGVGNVSAALRANQMWHQTVMIFSTDNGGPVPEMASNFPLRGSKGTCWEGGAKGIGFVTGGSYFFGHLWSRELRVTFPRGVESHAMIHVTDWLPTLCEIAGCDGGAHPTGTKALDGVSAWQAIVNNGSSSRSEILIDLSGEVSASPAIIIGAWKLVNTPAELYHLPSDPRESHNLAAGYPAKVVQMQPAFQS